MRFTFEQKSDETISFLDILVSKKRNDITRTVHRKPTCNYIYVNWNAYTRATWKRGVLKTLVERTYVICSTDQLLEEELECLEKVLEVDTGINGKNER